MTPEEIRASHKLQPVSAVQEAEPLGTLPDNIFGYTYSPVNDATPLYARKTVQAFEIHKLSGGLVRVLGYVTAQEAERFEGGRESMEFHLYPEPYDESKTLIALPLERLVRAKPSSRIDGNYMPVQVEKVS